MRLLARKASWHEQAPAAMTPHQRMRDFRCCQLPRPAAGRTRQVGGEQGLLAEVGVRSCPRPEPGGGGQRPGRRSPAACWRGWERNGNHGRSCARSGALACSPVRGPHLRKRGNSLVARLWMLSWGQGVAGSNPAVPTGFSNTCTRIGNENRPTGNDHARRPASAHRNPAPPSRAAVALEPTTARHRVARPGRTGGPDGARRGFKTAHRSQRRGRRAAGAARPLRQRPQ